MKDQVQLKPSSAILGEIMISRKYPAESARFEPHGPVLEAGMAEDILSSNKPNMDSAINTNNAAISPIP